MSQPLQLPDQLLGAPRGILPLQVIRPQLPVGHLALQDVVHDPQQRVPQGHQRPLPPAPTCLAAVLRRQIGVGSENPIM